LINHEFKTYKDRFLKEQAKVIELAAKNKAERKKRAKEIHKNVDDPIFNSEKREMLRFACNFHFQLRVHANMRVHVLNRKHEDDLKVRIEGVDLSICNPVGPLNAKLSLMMKRFIVDTFIRKSELKKSSQMNDGQFSSKKKGIFENERGTVRGDKGYLGRDIAKQSLFEVADVQPRTKL